MKKIVTFGVFDYFHLGHLRLIKQCRQYGDYLIIAVQRTEYITRFKPEAKPLYSTEERVEILRSIREVDEVVIYDEVNVKTLEALDFDILALGEDHVGERFDAIVAFCTKHNKDVVRLKRTEGISTTEIKEKIGKLE